MEDGQLLHRLLRPLELVEAIRALAARAEKYERQGLPLLAAHQARWGEMAAVVDAQPIVHLDLSTPHSFASEAAGGAPWPAPEGPAVRADDAGQARDVSLRVPLPVLEEGRHRPVDPPVSRKETQQEPRNSVGQHSDAPGARSVVPSGRESAAPLPITTPTPGPSSAPAPTVQPQPAALPSSTTLPVVAPRPTTPPTAQQAPAVAPRKVAPTPAPGRATAAGSRPVGERKDAVPPGVSRPLPVVPARPAAGVVQRTPTRLGRGRPPQGVPRPPGVVQRQGAPGCEPETAPPAEETSPGEAGQVQPSPAAEIDLDALMDRVERRFIRRLEIESERRGGSRWHQG